jgi:hypothetical protein
VRVLLSFDDACLGNLPWELTRWHWSGSEICLGSDHRVALSRLEYRRDGFRRREAFGKDGALSIFHNDPAVVDSGAAGSGTPEFMLTRDFLRMIDDHVVRLHATSRSSSELQQYWRDSHDIAGGPPEMDIVHWDSHGGQATIEHRDPGGKTKYIDAAKLLELTRSAFLYVIRACDVTGKAPHLASCSTLDPASFSAALLEAGAPVVLGTHGAVYPGEFARLPMLYPLMFQGLPLDYCVQFMRRLLANISAERQSGPHDRWYKLILRTTSTWYLDAAPASAPFVPGGNPIKVVELLGAKLEQLKRAARDAGGTTKAETLVVAMLAPMPGDGGADSFWNDDCNLPRQVAEAYQPT